MELDHDTDRNVDHPVDLTADLHHFSDLTFDHFQELERVLEPTERKNILGKPANHEHLSTVEASCQ
jgi:hypothetical protein